jgi:hypothetical protein
MTSRTNSTRQYALIRVRKNRCTSQPSFIVRLDDVLNKGCILKRIEEQMRTMFPHIKINRSAGTLRITCNKKRALYLTLDPIVATAIDNVSAIHAMRHADKAAQDYRPERQLKSNSLTAPRTSRHAHVLVGRITGSSTAGFDPLELLTELSEGLKIPATV